MNDPQRFRNTVRLSDSAVRLAESVAVKHDVTVPQLIEALLVQFAERARSAPLQTTTQPRTPARVIELAAQRRQRPV